jgi:3'-phosphoadenosine 5'-phosphosulfate sulfotransferase (PAPS reductase)/FAD synthetase
MSKDSKKAKVKEVVGAVTGDRRVEAKGRAEEKVARPDVPLDEVTAEVIDEEWDAVRRDHGDI